MSWFKKHLNWSLLISLFIGVILYSAASMVSWYVLLRIVAIVFMFVAQVWYLNEKNRSLGWLFLNLLGGVAYAGGSSAGLESGMFVTGLIMLFLKSKEREPEGITQPPSAQT
ncbi:hypothetical protein ACFLX4_03040 [Chloroflexota bacterium]